MKSNIQTRKLISALHKAGKEVKLWKRIAIELEKSTRSMVAVNISKLDKVVRDNEIALVPGKVLSVGQVSKPLTVAALHFSEAAAKKINAKGKTLSLEELLKSNPKGNKVRIIK